MSFEFLLRLLLLRGWLVLGSATRARQDVLLLTEDQLDVAWRRLVRIDAAVRAVCSTADLRRSVHLNVIDDEVINIETFDVGVRLGVLEQAEQDLGGLLRPATLRDFEDFRLRLAAHAAVVALERHDLLLVDHVLQVARGTSNGHASECVGGFTGVLEVNTQVGTARFARFGGVFDSACSRRTSLRTCRPATTYVNIEP